MDATVNYTQHSFQNNLVLLIRTLSSRDPLKGMHTAWLSLATIHSFIFANLHTCGQIPVSMSFGSCQYTRTCICTYLPGTHRHSTYSTHRMDSMYSTYSTYVYTYVQNTYSTCSTYICTEYMWYIQRIQHMCTRVRTYHLFFFLI